MIFFPNCKINIGLDVLRRRTDGFHDIETLMLPVTELCDILEVVPAQGRGADFSQSGLAVDCPPETNLVIRAYGLMARRYGIGGARIHLHKIIPSGAGLGGGSSDAASTIKGLNKVFGLELGTEEMEALAAELGSDTPFFIRNEPQLARGRGEILTPYPSAIAGYRLVVVKPDIHISTAEAYAGVTPRTPSAPLSERLAGGPGAWKDVVENAFEASVFARHPQLQRIKGALYGHGAVYASMSGSGSAVYGVFEGGDVPAERYTTTERDEKTSRIAMSLKEEFGDPFVFQQVIG